MIPPATFLAADLADEAVLPPADEIALPPEILVLIVLVFIGIVGMGRVELPRTEVHSALNAARIPVPPHPPNYTCRHTVDSRKTKRTSQVSPLGDVLLATVYLNGKYLQEYYSGLSPTTTGARNERLDLTNQLAISANLSSLVLMTSRSSNPPRPGVVIYA